MAKSPTDPLRARLAELLEEISNHQNQLRDFANIPGNTWLAKAELSSMMTAMSDLETLLEDIKQQDAENGYS
ncbi:MAG TPA: hypothetical protein VI322_02665 [Candidatus Saccharimonadia bacterium]